MDVEESPWADSSQPSEQAPEGKTAPTQPATPKSTSTPAAPRPSRAPRRLVAQPTRLEAVDDPLGPLGSTSDDRTPAQDAPPVPPQKEQVVIRTTMPQQQQQARRPVDPHRIDDDGAEESRGPRPPPPVDAARPSNVRTSTQPSVSVEQASKPTFQITVGDPHKVGDLTSSHIVYSVRTRVSYEKHLKAPYVANRCVRLPPRDTSNPNLRSNVDIATSFGSTPLCTATTPVLSYHPLRRNRRLDDLIATSSRADARL